jgi:HTH-type transcriptional regulator/antitoxin HigA
MKNIKDLVPAVAIHPGEILQDEIEAAGFSQRSFAADIGVQPSLLNEIIKGKRNITADMALLLEASLGVEALYWMNLQTRYELDLARIKEAKEKRAANVAQWQELKQFIPYKFFITQGLLQGDPQQDVPKVLEIYKAASVASVRDKAITYEPAYFRKSAKLKVEPINLAGWVHAAKYMADRLKVAAFDISGRDSLIRALRKAISVNKNLIEEAKRLLAKAGIKLLILDKPDKTPVDGLCFWSANNPVIVLTLRHKQLDRFAFNLFHELGHVYEHLVKHPDKDFVDLDLEEDGEEVSVMERQANEFACNMLVPNAIWDEFIGSVNRMNDEFIASLAESIEVHPAVLVGRRCHAFGKFNWQSSISRAIG